MTTEKILIWLGSGLIATLIGRTILLFGDSRYITRSEYTKATEAQAKVTQELKDGVSELSEAIVAHTEQIKALERAQQTTNQFLQAIASHVGELNARDRRWYEEGRKRHTQDGEA